MGIKSYKDLTVWQKAMDLTVMIYDMSKSLPEQEQFVLSEKMRRAAASVPSYIAEGSQRFPTEDYIHFLFISKGSLAELETQIYIAERLNYISRDQMDRLLTQCTEVGKLLNALINRLQNANARGD